MVEDDGESEDDDEHEDEEAVEASVSDGEDGDDEDADDDPLMGVDVPSRCEGGDRKPRREAESLLWRLYPDSGLERHPRRPDRFDKVAPITVDRYTGYGADAQASLLPDGRYLLAYTLFTGWTEDAETDDDLREMSFEDLYDHIHMPDEPHAPIPSARAVLDLVVVDRFGELITRGAGFYDNIIVDPKTYEVVAEITESRITRSDGEVVTDGQMEIEAAIAAGFDGPEYCEEE